MSGHESWINSVAFCHDGKRLASGSEDHTVRLWDPETGRAIKTLGGHTNGAQSVAFSPDDRTLAVGCYDATIRLWDISLGRVTRTLHCDNVVHSVAYSSDGKMLASGGLDAVVRIWDLSTGRVRFLLKGHRVHGALYGGDRAYVWCVAFSPDGKTLASVSETVVLWDASTGKVRATLKQNPAARKATDYWMTSVAFSPDGRTIAAGSDDSNVRLWDVSAALGLPAERDGRP